MAQINDITSYILEKLSNEADAIIKEAQAKHDEELSKAANEADIRSKALVENAHAEAEKKIEMAKASAKQIVSKEILKIKNEAVKNVLSGAKNSITASSDKDYEELLISLLKKYHENKKGEIILSSIDENRSLDLLKKEAEALGLSVSKEKKAISGGFILKYGNIEENCSLDAVFKEKEEELTDYINSNLFK